MAERGRSASSLFEIHGVGTITRNASGTLSKLTLLTDSNSPSNWTSERASPSMRTFPTARDVNRNLTSLLCQSHGRRNVARQAEAAHGSRCRRRT
jgi:hypothetical protein